jgi:hypothetical protein
MDDRGVLDRSPEETKKFTASPRLPDCLCDPPSLLLNGYRESAREGNFSLSLSIEVTNEWSHASTSLMTQWRTQKQFRILL